MTKEMNIKVILAGNFAAETDMKEKITGEK